jgi:hypothetical protein
LSECNEYIKRIYEDKKVNEFLSRIHPSELQDDLRQEMAVVLLNYDCLKLATMFHSGNLVSFAKGILWNMGRCQKGEFYRVFKARNDDKAKEYLRRITKDSDSLRMARMANKILEDKLMLDANEAHESIIFSKYVELGSCVKVAEFFGIPKYHVDRVVTKCRQELKKSIKQKL